MKKLRSWSVAVLQKDYGRGYEVVVGALAFASALFMSVPFAAPMTAAILFQPKRWRRIVFATSLGGAAGSTALLWALHVGAWHWLARHQSGWVTGTGWASLDQWLAHYGKLALFAVMTLPVPESPALAFLAREPQPFFAVFLVMLAGKLLKYAAYGYATVRVRKRVRASSEPKGTA